MKKVFKLLLSIPELYDSSCDSDVQGVTKPADPPIMAELRSQQ